MGDLDLYGMVSPGWEVSGRAYRDTEVFQAENERVFERCWIYLAHESEIAEPGSWKAAVVAGQPVVVVRDEDGRVHGLLNRCRHRAASVCQGQSGSAHMFRCAYHGWTYGLDGSLKAVTYDQAYDSLDRSKLGLTPLGAVDTFRGFVFGRLSPEGPTLEEYLGAAAPYLEMVADQGTDGIELSAGVQRLSYRGNWKLQVENTIDNYHFAFVHKSYLEILRERSGTSSTMVRNILKNPTWRTIDLGNGHSVAEFGDPRTGGHGVGIGTLPFNLIIFPTLGFVGAQLRQVIPLGPSETEVRLYPMMMRGAPPEESAALLRAHEGFYGPAGFGGPDDLEVAFERVTDGLDATVEDHVVFSRGAATEEQAPDGSRVGSSADEVPQRAFYRQWARMMEALS